MIDQSVERLHLFINAQRGLQHQSMSESGWPFPLTQPWFHHVKQSLQVLPLKIAYQWASSPQWIIWAGTLPCHTVSKSPLSVCWCAALALWLYKSGLGPFVWLDWSCCSLFMKGRNLSAFLFINQDWHCHCPKKDLCKMWPLLPVVLLTSDTKQIDHLFVLILRSVWDMELFRFLWFFLGLTAHTELIILFVIVTNIWKYRHYL